MVSDIHVRSSKSLKSINCPSKLNSSAIDEFLIIFLAAAKAKGVSYFKNLEELNKKESRRLDWGSKILSMMGVKNKLIKNHGIKIWGQPNLKLNKKYEIKNLSFCNLNIKKMKFQMKFHFFENIQIKK